MSFYDEFYSDGKDAISGLLGLYQQKQQLDAATKIAESAAKQAALNNAVEAEERPNVVTFDPRLAVDSSGGVSVSLNMILVLGVVVGATYLAVR